MQLTLISRKTLNGIPSVSGIEIVGDKIYLMGDDSPWLFMLDQKFELLEKFPIGDVAAAASGKIPKKQKPDLEAMVSLGDELLLFGSGSKSPQRDVLVRVNTVSKKTTSYSLLEFYDSLCASANFTREDLNIEAAVIVSKDLFLFNRGKNIIFKLNVREFLLHAEGNGKVPACEKCHVTLPVLNAIPAGFSGATVAPDGKQIIFTASVENTSNWIDDGEILGSFVGILSLNELKDGFSPACITIADKEQNILKIKVEAVAVQRFTPPNTFQLLLVTDNDSSSSEILEMELAC